LDDNKFIAAIVMDLSKAFDCLPHNLLMLKLEAYGLSENSLKLLKSYLENRRQRIKIGNNYSEWDPLIIAVPQGSNAFDRSITIAAINLLSSKAFFQSSIILSKAV
jgi:hypothetical protein